MNNTTNMFDNDTTLITISTTRSNEGYVKRPFDSYIGGLLFMFTVIVVLLYANFYQENTFQILWIRLLTKLHIIPPPSSSQTISSTSHSPVNRLPICP
jgi:hypothetical protein